MFFFELLRMLGLLRFVCLRTSFSVWVVGFVKLHQSPGSAVNVSSCEVIDVNVLAARLQAFINKSMVLTTVFKIWILRD
jgi:hypothetical protein